MTEQTRCAATVESKLKVYSFFGGVRLDETPHEPCNQPIRQKADGEGWEHYRATNEIIFSGKPWVEAVDLGHRATPPVEEVQAP